MHTSHAYLILFRDCESNDGAIVLPSCGRGHASELRVANMQRGTQSFLGDVLVGGTQHTQNDCIKWSEKQLLIILIETRKD